MEGLRLRTGLLADLGVQDEDPLLGLGDLCDPLDLLDEVVLQRVPSGGIDDDDLLVPETVETVLDDECGVGLTGLPVDLHADLLAQLLQLV